MILTEDISRYYDLPVERGVLVTKVMEGSPAQHAGIVAGEIILRLNDAVIYRIEDLLREIHKRRIGEKVMIAIFRGGREQFFEITLCKMP